MELPPFNFPNPLGLFGGSKQVSICDASDVIKNTNGNRRRSKTATTTIKQRSTGMAKIGYYHWQHFLGSGDFFFCLWWCLGCGWMNRTLHKPNFNSFIQTSAVSISCWMYLLSFPLLLSLMTLLCFRFYFYNNSEIYVCFFLDF